MPRCSCDVTVMVPWLVRRVIYGVALLSPSIISNTYFITIESIKRNYHQVSNLRHLSWQLNSWSLRYSWGIACRRCSNYIFILDLTPGFNGLGKDEMRIISSKFGDLVQLILQILRYQNCLWPHNSGTEIVDSETLVLQLIFHMPRQQRHQQTCLELYHLVVKYDKILFKTKNHLKLT